MRYNEKKVSAKSLQIAFNAIDNLTEAAAEVAAIFHAYQIITEETGLPIDAQSLEEISQMFATVNRMVCRQKADLNHLKMMQDSMSRADEVKTDLRSRKRATDSQKDPVLFQHTA